MTNIIIIGTGLAGYNLAREIRKRDKTVGLQLFSEDDGAFYSKPMLSNALAKQKQPAQLAMKSAEQMAQELNADIRSDISITHIDPQAKQIQANGETFSYDKLVLAVGARPFVAPAQGDAVNAVMTVNNLTDYAQFRTAIEGKRHVAIIGPGLIGCEFANDLVAADYQVTVIGPDKTPLEQLLPAQAGEALQQKLQQQGVQWKLGLTVAQVNQQAEQYQLTLSDGSVVQADVVLSAIGLRADLTLAQQAGLACERGIVVDRYLTTSDASIFALGDCAQVDGLVLPFVLPLMQSARTLATTLTGEQTAVSYPPMPVVIKTPAYPIVVSPPPRDAQGQWQVDATQEGVTARFLHDDALLGFALTGTAVSEKQALTKLLPAVLADV